MGKYTNKTAEGLCFLIEELRTPALYLSHHAAVHANREKRHHLKKNHLNKHYLKNNIYTLFKRKAIDIKMDSKSYLEVVAPVADTMCFDQSALRVEVEINWIG